MLITTFTSKATKGLLPLSPYDDLTFDFKTYSVNNLKSMFRRSEGKRPLNSTVTIFMTISFSISVTLKIILIK